LAGHSIVGSGALVDILSPSAARPGDDAAMSLFEGFTVGSIDVGEVELYVRHSGTGGAPVLLLHGHPRTGATWHRVAPQLVAAGHTVVVPDLRGYGRSSKPATTPEDEIR